MYLNILVLWKSEKKKSFKKLYIKTKNRTYKLIPNRHKLEASKQSLYNSSMKRPHNKIHERVIARIVFLGYMGCHVLTQPCQGKNIPYTGYMFPLSLTIGESY